MAEQDYTAPTTKPATTRTTTTSTAPSPEEELKKLKEALSKDQREAERLKKRMDESQARIKDYEKAVAETGQVTGGFTTAMQAVAEDRTGIADFLKTDFAELEKSDEIKAKKAEIEARIQEIDSAIEAKNSDVNVLAQKLQDEKAAQQAAADDHATKKKALDELKDRGKAVADQFAKMKKLRQRMDGEGASKPLIKYALALELKRVWDETTPLFVSKEQLEASYYAAAEDVRAAAAQLADTAEKQKALQSALDGSRKELEARRAGRLDDILKRMGELSLRTAAASASAAAAAGRGAA